MGKLAISACMAGRACRYDATAKQNEEMIKLARSGEALIFCPESLGGLPVPRPPAEIVGGDGFDVLDGTARVMNKDGEDVTKAFIEGAERVLALLKFNKITEVYLKERSPSCGVKEIYDGTFSGQLIAGMGVTAALLTRNGIVVRAR